jgi:membrane protein YqaA with SNARE-associated domain
MPLETWGLLTSTFLVCLGSAIVPFVNAELYLLGVSALAPKATLPSVVLAATLGQMAGKSVLFCAGRGASFLPARFRQVPPGLQARLAASRLGASGLVLTSACLGLPPFFAVTLLAGTLGWSFPRFLFAGTLGRTLRFAAVVALPQYVPGLAS